MDLDQIEETYTYTAHFPNPYHTYLIEKSDKIKKQALNQIINNALGKKNKNSILNSNNISNLNSTISSDTTNEFLTNKYIMNNLSHSNIHEAVPKSKEDQLMKNFWESCEANSLITLDQKIDYFVYLKANNNKMKTITGGKDMKTLAGGNSTIDKRKANDISGLNNSNNFTNNNFHPNVNIVFNRGGDLNLNQYQLGNQNTLSSLQDKTTPKESHLVSQRTRGTMNFDIYYRYINDLKNKFKINEEINMFKVWETYYNELIIKINSFKSQNKIAELSNNNLEKLKQAINCKEISNDRIILRECDLTSDKFYFLIAKKVFDFRLLHHINLSKNNLGDVGSSYLLYLLDLHATRIDYLNISYNKIGKQSVDLISNILQKNILKLASLNINGNQLGDKFFSEICIGLSKNSHTTKFFCADNDLGKISAIILGTILKYDKKLKFMDISKNLFDDEIIGFIYKGLISNSCLETFMINESNISNKSIRILETTLHINSSLKELFLEKNKLTNKCCSSISEILNKNKSLEFLSLLGNKIDADGIDLILDRQRKIPIKIINKTDFFQVKCEGDSFNDYM